MSRLLLLACSARKRSDPGRLPAIERYDGPAYRVLRRYVQSSSDDALDVFILSAQFGLIRSDEPIPIYDHRMTPQRAQELRELTATRLLNLNPGRRYQEIFLHAGMEYREILAAPLQDALLQERVITSTGSQGMQLSRLKSWLYHDENVASVSGAIPLTDTVPVRFKLKGTEYGMTAADVIAVARLALKNGLTKGLRATAWYVLVDGQRIPPKWLVSQLTGLPVSDFHSIEARRVLTQFGLPVRQV